MVHVAFEPLCRLVGFFPPIVLSSSLLWSSPCSQIVQSTSQYLETWLLPRPGFLLQWSENRFWQGLLQISLCKALVTAIIHASTLALEKSVLYSMAPFLDFANIFWERPLMESRNTEPTTSDRKKIKSFLQVDDLEPSSFRATIL